MFGLILKIALSVFVILSFYLINYARNICEIFINIFIATYVYIANM